MAQRFALVTGVSSGIGRGIAEKLAAQGMHVLGSVRKPEDAAPLVDALAGRFTPLVFDVRDEEAIAAAVPVVAELVKGAGLAGLVNNAGIGNSGPVVHVPMEEIRLMFDVNVFGALQVTRAFLPFLGAAEAYRARPGRIVNISSVAGRIVYPFNATYAASKFALEALSDGLRRELTIYGIGVVVVEPGLVKTPMWGKRVGRPLTIDDVPRSLFSDTDYAPYFTAPGPKAEANHHRAVAEAVDVERVSEVVWEALTAAAPRTRYMLPDGTLKRRLRQRYFYTHMPDEWVDRRIALGRLKPG